MGNKRQIKPIVFALAVGVFLLAAVPGFAQQITGKVTDSTTGEPMPGVNIFLPELETGAATNVDGEFEITNIDPGSYTLTASYVGYESYETSVEVPAGENVNVTIELVQGLEFDEELVVVGYGTAQADDVTGSVSSVSGEDLNIASVTSIDQGLQGQSAGVVVSQSGTKPGSAADVRIRGNRSINASNEPLYVVDGVPLSGGLQDINPASIQSIEVLKDASATAIYGARGSNGVIIVSTNRGFNGDLQVNYNGTVGFSRALGKVDRMNGEEYAELNREAYRAAGEYESDSQFLEPAELEKLENGEWVDYQDLMLQTGVRHNHSLSIAGGNESTQFNVAFGGLQEEGILAPEDYSRYNLQINLDMDITDKLKIGTSTMGSYSVRNGGDQNFYIEALRNSPLGSPWDENGNLVFQPIADGQRSNPLIEVQPETYVDEEKRQRLLSNIFAEYNFTDNLNYRMNFAPDIQYERDSDYQASRSRARFEGPAAAQKADDFVFEYTWENIVNYEQVLAEKHSVDFTGLFSIQEREQEPSSMEVRGIPVESMRHYNFGAAQDILGTDTSFEKWTLLSSMLRTNYNYDDRYLITATGRLDGSSRFGENNKYGFFPSAAFSWNIANEDFFSTDSFLSDLRLRLSWGKTGQTGIDAYQTRTLLDRTTYNFGSDPAYGYQPSQIGNADLKWETTESINMGLEFGFFESRITGSIDVYQQNTEDLLLERQLPTTSGYSSILENVGSTRNSGIEFSLSSYNIQSDDARGFEWTTDFNFASNKEEIVELYGGSEDDVGNEWFIGEPIGVIFDYDQVGIWQSDEADQAAEYNQIPGEVRVRDINNDGQINADDRTIIGQDMPKYTGGMTNNFSYRGLDLSISLYGSFGNTIYSSIHESAMVGRYNNQDVDYWTPNNPVNRHPRPTINREYPIYNDARLYYDGSFIKVRNMELGYNLPAETVQNVLGVQSLRVYASAQQPFILSSYVQRHGGIDPEYASQNTPARWQTNFGINLTF